VNGGARRAGRVAALSQAGYNREPRNPVFGEHTMRVRVIAVLAGVLWLAGVATAQAPPSSGKPVASLAQVMRGIFFPNANILFDVQTHDPAEFGKKVEGTSTSSTFSGIYTGWQVAENAALALDEAANLLLIPGRMCENGRPVPLGQADWKQWVAEMKTAAQKMYQVAKTKNREQASDTTNDVAGACENCHTKYRDTAAGAPRCTP